MSAGGVRRGWSSGPPNGQLLQRPAIAVGVTEVDKRAPGQYLDLAHLDATIDELSPGLSDIPDDDLEAGDRARLRVDKPGAERNGTGRSGRGDLHKSDVGVDPLVVVRIEPNLIHVKGLGAVHIGHGLDHELDLPAHRLTPPWAMRVG